MPDNKDSGTVLKLPKDESTVLDLPGTELELPKSERPPEFPFELLEQADVIPEEEQLGLQTAPSSFWEQLIYGQKRPPGTENIPAGLIEIYKTAGIGRGGVWQPLGELTLRDKESVRKAAETYGIYKLIDITERPMYSAHNMVMLMTKARHEGKKPSEMPTFKELGQAAVDGLRGKQHGSTLDLIKYHELTPPQLKTYNDFLERYSWARYTDKATEVGVEFAAACVLEAGYYKGLKTIATKTPGIRSLVKGMFDDVGKATLHRGFNESIETWMEKSKLYKEVMEKLGTSEAAAKTWAEQADEVMRFVSEEGLTVRGVWPQRPTVSEMTALAEQYGIQFVTRKNLEAPASFVRLQGAHGEIISQIRLRSDIVDSLGKVIVREGFYTTTPGQIFLHELAHGIRYKLPANLSSEWDEFYKAVTKEFSDAADSLPLKYGLKKVLNDEGELVWESPTREIFNAIQADLSLLKKSYFPTENFFDSADEGFAEVFAFMNSGEANKVPAETAAKFISIMRDAGVPYADITKIVERAMGLEYLNTLVKTKIITSDSLQNGVKAVSMGKKSKLKELNDVELKSLVADVVSAKTVKNTKLGITGRIGLLGLPTGGPPPWKMFENFGIPHAYDLVDEGMSTIQNLHMERGAWMKDVMRRYKKQFGKDFDDIADQVAGRIADEGPSAIVPGRFAMISDDEVTFLRRIVDEDRAMFWEKNADRAEQLGLIGEGTKVPREEHYFHHRRKVIESMIERNRRRAADDALGVLPSDYAIERITKEKIPAGVNVPEFFARRSEEAIEYSWRATSSIAYREELRKLYLEPALRRLDFILDEMPGQYRKVAKQYAHDWVRNIRGIPSAWDDRLNDFNAAVMRKIPGLKNTQLAQERGYEQLAKGTRRIVFTGTIGLNSRTWVKQGFQSMLTVNTIGDVATYAGWESMFTDGGKRLLNQYRVMAGGRRLALTDITSIGKIERGMTLPFAALDQYVNCAGAGNGAVWYLMNRSRKNMDELAEYAVKKGYKKVTSVNFWDVMADAVEDGRFQHVIDAANKNIKYTQWSYNYWDMPRHLWSQTGKTLWMFTTWPSNFFGAHLPQLWTQLVHGENVFGEAVTPNQRLALIRYIAQTTAIAALARKMGYDMDWTMVTGPAPKGYIHGWMKTPIPVSPPSEFGLALGDIIINAYTGDLKRMDDSLKLVLRSMTPFVPAGVTIQRAIKWKKGEAPPEYIFLPKKLPPKKKPSPLLDLEKLGGGLQGLKED